MRGPSSLQSLGDMALIPSRHSQLRTTAEELARDAFQAGNITEAVRGTSIIV